MNKNNFDILQTLPTLYRPIVTNSDGRKGYIVRYFVRPINNKLNVTEVDSGQFDIFKANPLYLTTKVDWRLIGPKQTKKVNNILIEGIDSINKTSVKTADLTFGGLMNYIVDYTEFWLYEA